MWNRADISVAEPKPDLELDDNIGSEIDLDYNKIKEKSNFVERYLHRILVFG